MNSSPPRPDCSIGVWSNAACTAWRMARFSIIGDFQFRKKTSQLVGRQDLGDHSREILKHGVLVVADVEPEVVVTCLQPGNPRRLVRHGDELDRVRVGVLGAAVALRAILGGRRVVIEALEAHRRVALPLDQAIRAGADVLIWIGHRVVAGRVEDRLGVDRAGLGVVGERDQDGAIRLAEAELDRVVVDLGQLAGLLHEALADAADAAPALDRGDSVGRLHLLAVVEHDPLAEGHRVGQTVFADGMRLHQLGDRLILLVVGEEPLIGAIADVPR